MSERSLIPDFPLTKVDGLSGSISAGRILFGRVYKLMRRDPGQIVGAIVFPLIFFGLFTLIMGRVMAAQGFNYAQQLPAAIIIQAMLFTAMASASAIAADHMSGLYARLRTLPIDRSAPIMARVAGDLIRGSLAVAIIFTVALMQGLDFKAGWIWIPLFFVMPLLFLTVVSIGMGLIGHWLKNTDSASAMASILYLMLLMLSTAFAPVHLFPAWLRPLVGNSPVTQVIEIMRGSQIGQANTGDLLATLVTLSVLWLVFLRLNIFLLARDND